MAFNPFGEIAKKFWTEIPVHFANVEILEFVIMPNHLHGIILINDKYIGTRHAVSLRQPKPEQFGKPVCGSIPTIIRSYKSAVTKQINEIRQSLAAKVWQANYYEHIFRNEQSYYKICWYILYNPKQWLKGLGMPYPNGNFK